MLINLSNHPSKIWGNKQSSLTAEIYGSVIDLPFPPINPEATENNIAELAKEYFKRITIIFDECASEPKANAVHIQGEFIFVYVLVTMLLQAGVKCVASTTVRTVEQEKDGKKFSVFEFVKFREYFSV